MLRQTHTLSPITPAPSAAIARARLQRALSVDRRAREVLPPPADDLLRRLLSETPADEGRAA